MMTEFVASNNNNTKTAILKPFRKQGNAFIFTTKNNMSLYNQQ